MKYLYILLELLAIALSIHAQNPYHQLHVERAGSLSEQLHSADVSSQKNLKITGEINAADIEALRLHSIQYSLERLDLSEATYGETIDSLLSRAEEYFLPIIEGFGLEDPTTIINGEKALGHTYDETSVPGFWKFYTHRGLFFMTGYMRGFDMLINEGVLKTERGDLLRSPQIRSWIEQMGYSYHGTRTDGDLIFVNKDKTLWCLLHFTPYGRGDYPGVHFSNMEYDIW